MYQAQQENKITDFFFLFFFVIYNSHISRFLIVN